VQGIGRSRAAEQQGQQRLPYLGTQTHTPALLVPASPTGGGQQPQLLVDFLEEHVAGTLSSPEVALDASSSGGGSLASLATIEQVDWRRLVSGMLDMCKGDQAITRATTRVVEMALAASARPQAGGSAEARLVAETRWVVMEVGGHLAVCTPVDAPQLPYGGRLSAECDLL
jgi:hypothetical protein